MTEVAKSQRNAITSGVRPPRPFAAYLLLAALFFAPVLLGVRTFPDGDFTHHFLPFSLFQQGEWLAGRWLPVWNPYTYAGHPFLADVQAAVFYPIGDLLLLLTLPWHSPAARLYFLELEAVLHIALAGFFTHLLVRQLTGSRQAAFIAGLFFAFSGYLTGYPPLQLAILRTAIWLPLILWLLLRAADESFRWRWWVGAALAWATAFLAGHPQTFMHLSYVVLGWLALMMISTFWGQRGQWGPGSSRGKQILAGLLACCFLTLAFSAVQLLPSLEFTGLSVRASVDYAYVSGGFPVRDGWQMLFPGILTQFSPLFIGIPGLALALLALTRIVKKRRGLGLIPNRRYPLFFALITGLALLLSLGDNGFLYPLFYRYAPGWNLFRGQERAAYLATFGLSILAGYGMATLPALSLQARRLAAGRLVIGVAGAGLIFGIFWQRTGRGTLSDGAFGVVVLLSCLVAVALAWLFWKKGWGAWRGWAIVGLGTTVLFWANAGTNVTAFGPARKTLLAPEVVAMQTAQSGGRAYNEFRVYEDYGVTVGVEDVWGSSPLRLAAHAALFDNFPLDRMWRLLGVETVLTWRQELFVPSELLATYPQATDTTYLHRLTDPNPRAWLVQDVQFATDAETLALIGDHNFDLDKIALLPLGGELPVQPGNFSSAHHPIIQLARSAPNRIHVTLSDSPGGLLILSENWLPGWHVQSPIPHPRNPIPVFRANLTSLALPLPPGDLAFDLVYWPDSLTWGILITGTTIFFVVSGYFNRRRRQTNA